MPQTKLDCPWRSVRPVIPVDKGMIAVRGGVTSKGPFSMAGAGEQTTCLRVVSAAFGRSVETRASTAVSVIGLAAEIRPPQARSGPLSPTGGRISKSRLVTGPLAEAGRRASDSRNPVDQLHPEPAGAGGIRGTLWLPRREEIAWGWRWSRQNVQVSLANIPSLPLVLRSLGLFSAESLA